MGIILSADAGPVSFTWTRGVQPVLVKGSHRGRRAKGHKVVQFRRIALFSGFADVGTTPEAHIDGAVRLHDHSHYQLERIVGGWGLSDDPIDEEVNIMLIVVSSTIVNDDLVDEDQTIWKDRMGFSVGAGGVTVIQTMNHVSDEIDRGILSRHEGAMQLLIGVDSDVGSSLSWDLTLYYTETYKQPNWKSDRAKLNAPWGDVYG